MDTVLEQLAQERADSLRRAWEGASREGATGEGEEFFVRALDTCSFVTLIDSVWGLITNRLQAGVAARLIDKQCAVVLDVARSMSPRLDRIAQDLPTKSMPLLMVQELKTSAQDVRVRLGAIIDGLERLRTQLNRPPCLTVGADEVRRRARAADENKEWLPLREVVAQIRSGEDQGA